MSGITIRTANLAYQEDSVDLSQFGIVLVSWDDSSVYLISNIEIEFRY